jgi:hypothetical protein
MLREARGLAGDRLRNHEDSRAAHARSSPFFLVQTISALDARHALNAAFDLSVRAWRTVLRLGVGRGVVVRLLEGCSTHAEAEARLDDATLRDLTPWPLAQAEHGIVEALGVPLRGAPEVAVGANNLFLARKLGVEPCAVHCEDTIILDGLPEERVETELRVAGRKYRELLVAHDRITSGAAEVAWGGVARQRAALRAEVERLRACTRAVALGLAARMPRDARGDAVRVTGLSEARAAQLKSEATTPMGGASLRRATGRRAGRARPLTLPAARAGVLSLALSMLRLRVLNTDPRVGGYQSATALGAASEEDAARILNAATGESHSARVWREALRRGIGLHEMHALLAGAGTDDERKALIVGAARELCPLERAEDAISATLVGVSMQPPLDHTRGQGEFPEEPLKVMVRRLTRYRDRDYMKESDFADHLNLITGEHLSDHMWRRALRDPRELEAAARAALRNNGMRAFAWLDEGPEKSDATQRPRKRRAQRQVRPSFCATKFHSTLLMHTLRTPTHPLQIKPDWALARRGTEKQACTKCYQPGHNSRTCTAPEEA